MISILSVTSISSWKVGLSLPLCSVTSIFLYRIRRRKIARRSEAIQPFRKLVLKTQLEVLKRRSDYYAYVDQKETDFKLHLFGRNEI
jgi:hypothetical protein